MNDWDDLRLFLAVAREGGLSAAARATGRSPATLGRRMLAFERSMGAELFIRLDRGYALTEQGEALLNAASGLEAQINRIVSPAAGPEKPLVKVSAGTWTTLALLDNIDHIVGKPADIQLRLLSGEKTYSLVRREISIGFRNKRPTKDGLAGRRLAQVQFAPYSTPRASQQWIKVLADTPSARWVDARTGRNAICEVNTPRNSLDLALTGLGIAVLPTFIGDTQDALTRAGPVIPELTHDQWLVTHDDDRHLPEIRRTVERIYSVLRRLNPR